MIPIQRYIYNCKYKTHLQKQVDTCCSGTNGFINFGLRFFDTRRETQFLRGRSRTFVCGLSSPVLGLHSVGRLTSGRFYRVCLGTGDFLRPQGAIPPGFYPLWGGIQLNSMAENSTICLHGPM